MTVSTPEQSTEILRRYATRNFWMNVFDGNAFIFGISMISRYTVLPLYVERLSGATWLQGLIPTLFYVGWLLPGLFMAPVVASMPRRKPWIMRATIGERVPFLILGLMLLLLPDLPVPFLLGSFFVLYAIHAFSAGFTSTAWQDFIARLIPDRRWGIFFGLQSGIGGVLGVAAATVATGILATQPFPQSIGILSLLCFAAMVVSYLFLGLTVEPPQEPAPRQPFRAFVGGIMPLLRRDVAFRRYLMCRAAIALGLVGHSFLTAAALVQFNPPDQQVGQFTIALLAAQALGNIGLGALADRWGHKRVLELSTALGMLALLLAILAPNAEWFFVIFSLVGISQAGYQLSGFTLVFAFSTPSERPTYIGVANTALAPVAALGPLVVGALAGSLGFSVLFAGLIAIGLSGLAALMITVPVVQTAAQRQADQPEAPANQ